MKSRLLIIAVIIIFRRPDTMLTPCFLKLSNRLIPLGVANRVSLSYSNRRPIVASNNYQIGPGAEQRVAAEASTPD